MNAPFRSVKAFILVCVLLFSVALYGQQPPVPLPAGVHYVTTVEGISEYRLQNGLRVLLFPDSTKTNITVNITYMVGSRYENYGETGMAHLLEHLLFMGSKNHTNIKKELQDHGTQPNGSTSFDRTNYFETFQATEENLKWALEMEADRMVNSFIAKKDLDSEMTVVRNEYEKGENDPLNVLQERVLSTAYLWHNYGHATIGARSDIERVPIEKLQAFYKHFYQPDNALLIVAGKIDEAKTLALVNQYYSPIPKPTRQLRVTYTLEPTQDGERSVSLHRVGDIQVLFGVYHVPSGTHEEFPAIEIATNILGEQPGGRLYKALVEPGKAAAVGTEVLQLMDPGVVLVFAAVRAEKSMDDVQAIMLPLLDDLKSKPFTDEEVNRAKTQFAKGFELLMNNSQSVSLDLSEWQAMGDWRMMFLYRDRYQKVTREQVQQAAEKYFIPSNRTLGRFYPDKNPVRAEVPPPPDVNALVKDYKSSVKIAKGEEFDPTPANIDKMTVRTDLKGGPKLSLLSKKSRGEQINFTINLRFGDEFSLKGRATESDVTAQMLTRGTIKHTRQQIKDEFDRLKAQVGISGGATGASATVQTIRENLKPVLELLAEVLKEPAFPQNEFEELRQSALASMEYQKSDPQAIAMNAVQRYLSPYPKGDVRYVSTLDEEVEEMKALDLEKVKAFYKDFYGASDSLIAFVGDFDGNETVKQISALFESWKSPKKYVRVNNKYQKIAPKTEVFQTPDKANAMWIAAAQFQMTDADPDYAAMTLAGYIFGSSPMNSRLFARIRNKEGLSYGVGSQFSIPTEDDNSVMFNYAICAPENMPKVEKIFKEELNLMIEKGFTSEEVAAAKKSWQQLQQVGRAQDSSLVSLLNTRRSWNRTMTFDSELEKKIAALTPEQLQAAVRKHIDPSQLSFFRAGDFKKVNVAW